MQRALSFFTLLPLLFATSGCAHVLRPASAPVKVKLEIQAKVPQQYSVRVGLDHPENYPVAEDGRIAFTVPSFQHGCDLLLFGAIKIRDGSAEKVRVINLRREERSVNKLSLSQIAKLPINEAGYSVLKIAD